MCRSNGGNGANPTFGKLNSELADLFGMTKGDNGYGNIFSINTDGTGFDNLFSFNGTDGSFPLGQLTLIDSTFYGMTEYGGSNSGTIFSINTDGTGFRDLYSFHITWAMDQSLWQPDTEWLDSVWDAPMMSGGTGSLSFAVPEPSTIVLLAASAVGTLAFWWLRRYWRCKPASRNLGKPVTAAGPRRATAARVAVRVAPPAPAKGKTQRHAADSGICSPLRSLVIYWREPL